MRSLLSIKSLLKLSKLFGLSCFLCSCFLNTNKQKLLLKSGDQVWSFQEAQDYMEIRLSDTGGEEPERLKKQLLKEILFMALLEDWAKEQRLNSKKILLKKEERSLFQKDPDKLKAFKKFKRFLLLKQNMILYLEDQIPDPPLSEQKAFYKKHKKQFQEKAQCRLKQIAVKEESLAQSLYERIKKGESFSDLAKKHSLQKNSIQVQKKDFPLFDKVCLGKSLQPPLKSEWAYHLFLKTSFQKAHQKSFLESQKDIIKTLKRKEVPIEFQKWLKQQIYQKSIWIDKKGLEKIKIQYK